MIKATFIGFISIVLWGTLALMTRLTDGAIPPFQLMFMTFTIAFTMIALRWWMQGDLGLKYARQPKRAWLLGIAGLFGYHFFYFSAMTRAPAVEVSLVAYLWPLLMVIFASLLPGHRFRLQHVIGAVIALAGCWLLLLGDSKELGNEILSGHILALVCAFIWSSYSVANRLIPQVPTQAVGWFCAATALLAFACHLMLESWVWPQSSLQWLGVAGLGIGPVGIAFFTWDHGVKQGNIQLLAVLSYSAPLISVLLLVVTGYAEPGLALALASIAIVAGSLIAAIPAKKQGA